MQRRDGPSAVSGQICAEPTVRVDRHNQTSFPAMSGAFPAFRWTGFTVLALRCTCGRFAEPRDAEVSTPPERKTACACTQEDPHLSPVRNFPRRRTEPRHRRPGERQELSFVRLPNDPGRAGPLGVELLRRQTQGLRLGRGHPQGRTGRGRRNLAGGRPSLASGGREREGRANELRLRLPRDDGFGEATPQPMTTMRCQSAFTALRRRPDAASIPVTRSMAKPGRQPGPSSLSGPFGNCVPCRRQRPVHRMELPHTPTSGAPRSVRQIRPARPLQR